MDVAPRRAGNASARIIDAGKPCNCHRLHDPDGPLRILNPSRPLADSFPVPVSAHLRNPLIKRSSMEVLVTDGTWQLARPVKQGHFARS